jgi:prepilin signal peptidase PulO-like enzyme (type II secretory pathway)
MKTLLTILVLFCSLSLSAQVTLNTKLGASVITKPAFYAGLELQADIVSVSVEFRPDYVDKQVYANGIGLFGTIYRWKYQSSPFFTIGIITHGSQKDEITGEAVRSMPIVVGYRFYPAQKWKYLDEDWSLDIGGGVELMRNSTVRPYIQFSCNYIISHISK